MATRRLHVTVPFKPSGLAGDASTAAAPPVQSCYKLQRPGETSAARQDASRIARETSDSRGAFVDAGAFQPCISGTKEKRQNAYGNRSIAAESMARLPNVSTRSCSSYSRSSGTGYVGDVDRSVRCVPTYSYSPTFLAVPSISGGQQTVPVYGAAVWAEHGTAGVLGSHESVKEKGSSVQHSTVSVPRRLADATFNDTGVTRAHSGTDKTVHSFRSAGQLREIRDGAHTEHCVLRGPPGFRQRLHLPYFSAVSSNLRQSGKSDSIGIGAVQADPLTVGLAGRDRENSAVRSDPLPHVASILQLSHQQQDQTLDPGLHTFRCAQRSPVVGGTVARNEGSPNDTTSSGSAGTDGCVDDGLGHQCKGTGSQRSLVTVRAAVPHKCFRDEDGANRVSTSSTSISESGGAVPDRQSDSGVLLAETGRHQVFGVVESHSGDFVSSRDQQCTCNVPTHQGQHECGGGPGITRRVRRQHRMDLEHRAVPMDPESVSMGASSDRSVCKSPQSPALSIFQPVPRRPCHVGRCPDDTVAEELHNLCFPTDNDSRQGAAQDTTGAAPPIAIGGTATAGGTVVPTTAADAVSPNVTVTAAARRSAAAALGPLSPKPESVSAASLGDKFCAIKQAGFSQAVLDRMAKIHTDSTNKVYLSQWRLFEAWCVKRQLDPVKATSVCVCDFFIYLFHDRKLQVKTIEGYRSALTFILKRASGYDLSECTTLADVIKSFKRERPQRCRTEVRWDISVVLNYLRSDVFTASTVPVKLLTFKCVFLLALALGKRRSELHAIQRDSVEFADGDVSVTLRPSVKFLSKTHISSKGMGAFKSATVPALPAIDGARDALCPVNTLRQYLAATDRFRSPGQRRLFISFVKSLDRDFSAQTISSYLKQLIVTAYKSIEDSSDDDLRSKYRIKAHQVRHIAHSLGQVGSMSLSEIIRTGGWTSASTFIQHYMQDLSSGTVRSLHEVGSFVAIQSIFQPARTVVF